MNEVFVFHRGQSYLHFQCCFESNTCQNLVKSEQTNNSFKVRKFQIIKCKWQITDNSEKTRNKPVLLKKTEILLSKPCGRDYWNCNKSDTSGVNRFPKKLVTALRGNKFPDLSQKLIYDVESLLTVSIATLVPEIKI